MSCPVPPGRSRRRLQMPMAIDSSRTHPRLPSADETHVINRAHWDAVAAIHANDEEFRSRLRTHGTSLQSIELAELSPRVAGKSRFISSATPAWIRCRGGRKGQGRSWESISLPRRSKPLAISQKSFKSRPSSSMQRLRRGRPPRTDVLRGVLLVRRPLLAQRSATVGGNVARLVAPGGLFYLVEFHPFVWALATTDRRSPYDGISSWSPNPQLLRVRH